MLKIFQYAILANILLCAYAPIALAGDGATIVLKSGALVYLNNGYKQLLDGMQNLKQKGTDNYPVEINIEGNTFFINLGEVAVMCRDKCSSLTLVPPKRGDSK